MLDVPSYGSSSRGCMFQLQRPNKKFFEDGFFSKHVGYRFNQNLREKQTDRRSEYCFYFGEKLRRPTNN